MAANWISRSVNGFFPGSMEERRQGGFFTDHHQKLMQGNKKGASIEWAKKNTGSANT